MLDLLMSVDHRGKMCNILDIFGFSWIVLKCVERC